MRKRHRRQRINHRRQKPARNKPIPASPVIPRRRSRNPHPTLTEPHILIRIQRTATNHTIININRHNIINIQNQIRQITGRPTQRRNRRRSTHHNLSHISHIQRRQHNDPRRTHPQIRHRHRQRRPNMPTTMPTNHLTSSTQQKIFVARLEIRVIRIIDG